MRRAARSPMGGKGRLHVRLVALFSVIAAVPTLLVVIFASLLFQYGVEFWFSDRARGDARKRNDARAGNLYKRLADPRWTRKTRHDGRRHFKQSQARLGEADRFRQYFENDYPDLSRASSTRGSDGRVSTSGWSDQSLALDPMIRAEAGRCSISGRGQAAEAQPHRRAECSCPEQGPRSGGRPPRLWRSYVSLCRACLRSPACDAAQARRDDPQRLSHASDALTVAATQVQRRTAWSFVADRRHRGVDCA